MQNLYESEVKFNVVLDGKIVATGTSRLQADLAVAALNESDRSRAQVVPVSNNGNQVLMG